jgi:hypothetical protein
VSAPIVAVHSEDSNETLCLTCAEIQGISVLWNQTFTAEELGELGEVICCDGCGGTIVD